ncbi:BH3-interacting domain death agonist [Varanus komodoensis]|nr:BH3-interacting domain death agonist [Varanus komodoensis]
MQCDKRHYHSTNILLYAFLEKSTNCAFAKQLCALEKQLLVLEPDFPSDDDGELQTDGNRFGRIQDEQPVDEDVFRAIGAQLAAIGDRLAAEIDPSFANNLAQQFLEDSVPKKEITRHLSQAVQELMRRMPSDMEQERAMLVAAMFLAKHVANKVPAVLQQVFHVTVNYINLHLGDYVNNLEHEVIKMK